MITNSIRPRIPGIDMQHIMSNTTIRHNMRRQIDMIERLFRVLERIRIPLPRRRVDHVINVGHSRLAGESGQGTDKVVVVEVAHGDDGGVVVCV